jgi:hypothetical protein
MRKTRRDGDPPEPQLVRIKLVSVAPFKDVSALYCDAPERFGERWASALAAAVPLVDQLNAGVRMEAAA